MGILCAVIFVIFYEHFFLFFFFFRSPGAKGAREGNRAWGERERLSGCEREIERV
jgi:hypothetical protein